MPKHPLAGKKILITRAASQMHATTALVKEYGANAIAFPCLEFQPLKHNIEYALSQISAFSDVLFTSVNGIETVARYANKSLAELLQNQRVTVVGSKTAQALQTHGVHADIIPDQASQEGLIHAYQTYGMPTSLLFFRAEQGNDSIINFLLQHHVKVRLIKAYRSICPQGDHSTIIQMLSQHRIDAVLLASPKTVEYYLQRIGNLELANQSAIVCISQHVADTADKLGLNVQLIAKQANFVSMLDSLADYFSQRSN